MAMPFQYVRRKDNPKAYIMAGYSDFTDQFDPQVYELIQGKLPEDARRQLSRSVTEKLSAIIAEQPIADRTTLYQIQAALHLALANKDKAAAALLIQQATSLEKTLKDRRTDVLQ